MHPDNVLTKLDHARDYTTLAWFVLLIASGVTWLFGKATKSL